MPELRSAAATLGWFALLAGMPWWPMTPVTLTVFATVVVAAPLVVLAWRHRSVPDGLSAWLACCLATAGMARGLMRHRRPPGRPVAGRILYQPPPALAPQSRHYA